MAIDPLKQDCHGLYLFGSGYFNEEDKAKERLMREPTSFCDECPVKHSCWNAHLKRTQQELPEEAEHYDRAKRNAEKKGVGPALFAAGRFRQGDPGPYFKLSQHNFKRGIAERRRKLPA